MKKNIRNQDKFPDPPEHLSEKTKELYNFYVGLTIRAPGQIAMMVKGLEALDQADECGAIIRKEGISQKSDRSGLTRQHPLLNTQKECSAAFLKIWKALQLEIDRCPDPDGLWWCDIV